MYVYCPFSPHNGITTGNVLILFFSPVNANFNFAWIYINLIAVYILSYFVFRILFFNYFCVFLCTRANFVIGLCAVKSARK
jgi:hypothetical protein